MGIATWKKGKVGKIAEKNYTTKDRVVFINSLDDAKIYLYGNANYAHNPYVNENMEYEFYLEDTNLFWNLVKDAAKNDKCQIDYSSEMFEDTWCAPAICGSLDIDTKTYSVDYFRIETDAGYGIHFDDNWSSEQMDQTGQSIPEYIIIELTNDEKEYIRERMEQLFRTYFKMNVYDRLVEAYDDF